MRKIDFVIHKTIYSVSCVTKTKTKLFRRKIEFVIHKRFTMCLVLRKTKTKLRFPFHAYFPFLYTISLIRISYPWYKLYCTVYTIQNLSITYTPEYIRYMPISVLRRSASNKCIAKIRHKADIIKMIGLLN